MLLDPEKPIEVEAVRKDSSHFQVDEMLSFFVEEAGYFTTGYYIL
jgi:hypothetical protein